MSTLAELIEKDSVTAAWFWTHEVSTGPYSEIEIWDAVFVRDSHEPDKWVTDGNTRRTAYFQGIGGCRADSRRETGGKRRRPDLVDALHNLLADAHEVEERPTLREWLQESFESGDYNGPRCIDRYETAVRTRDTLRAWLAEDYDAYLNAEH